MQEQSAGKPSNFILFIILTFGVLMLHGWWVTSKRMKEQANQPVAGAKEVPGKNVPGKKAKGEQDKPDANKPKGDDPKAKENKTDEPEEKTPDQNIDEEPEEEPAVEPEENEVEKPKSNGKEPKITGPAHWYTIGSADPDDPYRMLVTVTDRGAAVARIELNSPRYPSLMDDDGFIGPEEGFLAYTGGYLGRVTVDKEKGGKGCLVQVVGRGTPADRAGLVPDDLITAIDGERVTSPKRLHEELAKKKPGHTVKLDVLRDKKQINLSAELTRPPMEVVHPENGDPLSFEMTLSKLGKHKLPELEVDPGQPKDKRPAYINKEIPGLNLRGGTWEVADHGPDRIEFRCKLPRWGIELVKVYRLDKIPADMQNEPDYPAYNLVLDVKIQLLEGVKHARTVAYQLDGPTGLPIEGWWYANKVGIAWGAGLRDVIVSRDHQPPEMVSCASLSKDDVEKFVYRGKDKSLTYIGVDSQYFSAVLIPQKKGNDVWFDMSQPIRVGEVNPEIPKITDVSCRLRSITTKLTPDGKPLEHSFTIFAGPKRSEILAPYGLEELVYYGWFDFFARPMVAILHFFYNLVGNYGIAILMLTVLVRGLMYPMSRKQAKGAQKMAELQPEMKRIQEKYKKDMEARTKAQQELFKKHNYNPLSGCLVMFVQLPIFIGLYRGLMVDVELRGSSLLGSSIRWCSNLAAPDMLFNWYGHMPEWLTLGTGVFALGPYFNILPLITVVLFLLQQKMFMPPPADEQQKMQQNVMKYMMLFMGLLFFKVASGLCIYFIASSAWGLAERKLLPKTPKKDDGTPPPERKEPPKKKPDPKTPSKGKQPPRGKNQRRRK